MDTMIAYQLLNAQTQPEFQEVPERHAAPGQMLVKVGGSGFCHTDFKVISRDLAAKTGLRRFRARTFGRSSFPRHPNGMTDINVVIVREGKTSRGRCSALCLVLSAERLEKGV
jgi:hypothetical protein